MASHQDLLDAIARVRAATGSRDAWQTGLSGDDVATMCSALSTPSALGAVLTKIVAAHPESFLDAGRPSPPSIGQGLAADAIRDAQSALAQQNSAAAEVDLQVVSAVLNAHAANAAGAAELQRLQHEIENAVLTEKDLNTSAGAREFQRYLIGKLRDIRTVVDTAGLDATSKASLAAALAALYASATPPSEDREQRRSEPETPAAQPESPGPSAEFHTPALASESALQAAPAWESLDPAPYGLPDVSFDAPAPVPAAPTPAVVSPSPAPAPVPAVAAAPMAPPAMAAPAPAWGGGMPAAFGGGGVPADLMRPDPLPRRGVDALDETRTAREADRADGADPADGTAGGPPEVPDEAPPDDEPTDVHLPDGQTVSAPNPQVAAAMTAALAGTPIPDAFSRQGILLPAPGSALTAAVDQTLVVPGDIGVLADRHALALGNDKALLDQKIQPIASVTGPGFLGWLHPPVPGSADEQAPTPAPPEVPAPNRPSVATAPS